MPTVQIQESTKTRISFRGESAKDEDRTMVIRGTQDAVHQAELMVRKVIVDQPPIVSDTLTVPNNSVGRIIGEFHLLTHICRELFLCVRTYCTSLSCSQVIRDT